MKEITTITRIDWADDRAAKDYESVKDKIHDKDFTIYEIENAFVDGVNPVVFDKETEAGHDDLNGEQGYFYGKADSGRYISIIGIIEPEGRLIIQSAREMSETNKANYKRTISQQGGLL